MKIKRSWNGLREVAEKQGVQLDELNELIAENKRINKELKVTKKYILKNSHSHYIMILYKPVINYA